MPEPLVVRASVRKRLPYWGPCWALLGFALVALAIDGPSRPALSTAGLAALLAVAVTVFPRLQRPLLMVDERGIECPRWGVARWGDVVAVGYVLVPGYTPGDLLAVTVDGGERELLCNVGGAGVPAAELFDAIAERFRASAGEDVETTYELPWAASVRRASAGGPAPQPPEPRRTGRAAWSDYMGVGTRPYDRDRTAVRARRIVMGVLAAMIVAGLADALVKASHLSVARACTMLAFGLGTTALFVYALWRSI